MIRRPGRSSREKAAVLFEELVGDRAARLDGAHYNSDSAKVIAEALAELGNERAKDIAFHLTDWASDATFIVALQLFPERFSAKEIEEGVREFLIHAPNHVAAAAALGGWPVENIFGCANFLTPKGEDESEDGTSSHNA